MADDRRWSERDRDWRDDRGWEGRGGRGGGRGGYAGSRERWREMHADRRHEGPAGYNDSGPIQGGWEFGDPAQGGERGQGYDRYGYGRREDRYASPGSGQDYGRDPGVGSGYGETWGSDREYGRGGGYGAGSRASVGDWRGADRGSYDSSSQGGGWRGGEQPRGYGSGSRGGAYSGGSGYGLSQEGGGYAGDRSPPYGAHTPYGYRGRNEYDERGRGPQSAEGYRGQEDRSWLERAGDKVADFFGAGDEAGHHRGRGPKGYRRSDDRIREDISDRLTDDAWLDASNIDVEVKDCEVILKGEVASRQDKRHAEDLAESISGVRNVQNLLRVSDGDSDYDGFGSTRMTGEGERPATASQTLQNQAAGRTGSTAEKDQKGIGPSTGRQASSD
ncbi:MAG TPA: BON domain-containing protein [Caulobacteraceae bacterium]